MDLEDEAIHSGEACKPDAEPLSLSQGTDRNELLEHYLMDVSSNIDITFTRLAL